MTKASDGTEENNSDLLHSSALTERQLRIDGGGVLLWTPKGIKQRRRPCVTLGSFRNGAPCINFRMFSLQSAGLLAPTRDGISLTLAELDEVVARVRRIFAATVSLEQGKDATTQSATAQKVAV